MEFVRKIWKDPVWSKVISAGILAAIAAVYGFYGNYRLAPEVAEGGKALLSWLNAPYEFSRWEYFLRITAATFAGAGIVWWAFCRKQEKAESAEALGPNAYTQDKFFGMAWEWAYSHRGSVVSLTPLCANCLCEGTLESGWKYQANRPVTKFTCYNCKHNSEPTPGSEPEVREQVEAFIRQKLRTGEWRESLQRQQKNRKLAK